MKKIAFLYFWYRKRRQQTLLLRNLAPTKQQQQPKLELCATKKVKTMQKQPLKSHKTGKIFGNSKKSSALLQKIFDEYN